MLGKIALYVVGRRYGRQAMGALCRLAMSPNSKIDKTDRRFERWGAVLLLFAEFIPGVRTLAPPLAGAEKLSVAVLALQRARRGAMDGASMASGSYFASRSAGLFTCRADRQDRNRSHYGH
jgi:membrane protein DedA with SNARE-associated domain